MFKRLLIIIFLFIFFSHPERVLATLYINEFNSNGDSDWVEIYNSDSNSVDLSNYLLRDSTSSNKLDLTGNISGGGFATFDWSNKLNNDGDTIKLFSKAEGGVENLENQVVYGVPGDVSVPAGGQTAGRSPDGSSNWVILASASKGSSNNSAATVPTPTLTPTNSPTPTKTPTPTKSPTSSPSATPAKSTPPSTSSSIVNSISNDPTPTDDPNSSLSLASNSNENDISKIESPTPTPAEGEVLGMSTVADNFPWAFIGIGLIFLAVCGILAYFQFGDKILPNFLKKSNGQNFE